MRAVTPGARPTPSPTTPTAPPAPTAPTTRATQARPTAPTSPSTPASRSTAQAPSGDLPATLALAPLGEPLDGVRRIAVLRGGGLGDLLFASPALEALAARYPDAEITLLGTELHRDLLHGRPGPVDDVEVLPVAEGVREHPGEVQVPLDDFVARMRARRFDLAVQVHGGGRYSNPFLLALGARCTVGLRSEDAVPVDRAVPYRYYQHEVLRALEVVGLVGAAPVVLEPVVRVRPDERAWGHEVRRCLRGPVVVLHPGATDPRRRWPVEKFAELARRCAAAGGRVVVVGDGGDVEVAEEVAAASGGAATSLAGTLTLGELVGLLSVAAVVVGDDSGPRHLAQAVGCPTVGIYWVGNLVNAGPLSRGDHRVHLGWTTVCPTCGASQVAPDDARCDHDPSFVDGVGVDEVAAEALDLLARETTSSSTPSQRSRNASSP